MNPKRDIFFAVVLGIIIGNGLAFGAWLFTRDIKTGARIEEQQCPQLSDDMLNSFTCPK